MGSVRRTLRPGPWSNLRGAGHATRTGPAAGVHRCPCWTRSVRKYRCPRPVWKDESPGPRGSATRGWVHLGTGPGTCCVSRSREKSGCRAKDRRRKSSAPESTVPRADRRGHRRNHRVPRTDRSARTLLPRPENRRPTGYELDRKEHSKGRRRTRKGYPEDCPGTPLR